MSLFTAHCIWDPIFSEDLGWLVMPGIIGVSPCDTDALKRFAEEAHPVFARYRRFVLRKFTCQ